MVLSCRYSWQLTAGPGMEMWQRICSWSVWFFRDHYLLWASLLGFRSPPGVMSQRGTVFLEIDGLGHDHLRQALRQGHLPFLQKLLASDRYQCHRWRCGLVADTPASQSGLLYGTSDGIPGFYWFDRVSQKRVSGANPVHMRRQERLLAAKHRGLLEGGSSYASIISGGARWNVLTIAGTDSHWFGPGQALLRTLIILLLSPGKVLRFVFDAAWEILQDVSGSLWSVLRRRRGLDLDAFPLIRVLLNILPREIVSTGTRLDMLRGAPVIYSCFIGYDVIGHRCGPTSGAAWSSLRGIDSAIANIFETRSRCAREYDIVLLSDHGMTPSAGFIPASSGRLDEWVTRWWMRNATYPSTSLRQPAPGQSTYKSSGWLDIWGRFGTTLLEVVSAGVLKLGERVSTDRGDPNVYPQVVVISCGSMAQLWVRGFQRPLHAIDLEDLAPGFVTALAARKDVALVVTRDNAGIMVVGCEGRLRLRMPASNDAGTRLIWQAPLKDLILQQEGVNPLLRYEEPAIVLRQLISFLRMEACGDIVCLADIWRPADGKNSEVHTFSFEEQDGCHAAFGGDQAYPFILLPNKLKFRPETIGESSHMYPVLKGIVDPSMSTEQMLPIAQD